MHAHLIFFFCFTSSYKEENKTEYLLSCIYFLFNIKTVNFKICNCVNKVNRNYFNL